MTGSDARGNSRVMLYFLARGGGAARLARRLNDGVLMEYCCCIGAKVERCGDCWGACGLAERVERGGTDMVTLWLLRQFDCMDDRIV